jgi:hypothetical protein
MLRALPYIIGVWFLGWLFVSAFWFHLSLRGYRRNYRSNSVRPEHRWRFWREYVLSVFVLVAWWPGPVLWGAWCWSSDHRRQSREKG